MISLWGLLVSALLLVQSAQAQNSTPPAPVYRGVMRAYLGVFLGDAPNAKGAIVGKVVNDSPAAKAGIQVNDVILNFDQTEIENAAHVNRLLGELSSGANVSIKLLRGDSQVTLPVILSERQAPVDACQRLYAQADLVQIEANRLRQLAEEARQKGNEDERKKFLEEAVAFAKQAAILREDVDKAISEGSASNVEDCKKQNKPNRQQFGLSAIQLSDQLAQFFNVKDGTGLLITAVKAGSLAERQGLKAGDCLLTVNGKPVNSLAELNRWLNPDVTARAKSADKSLFELTLVIVRDGNPQTLKINLS